MWGFCHEHVEEEEIFRRAKDQVEVEKRIRKEIQWQSQSVHLGPSRTTKGTFGKVIKVLHHPLKSHTESVHLFILFVDIFIGSFSSPSLLSLFLSLSCVFVSIFNHVFIFMHVLPFTKFYIIGCIFFRPLHRSSHSHLSSLLL